jgi:hypothetical protein
MKKILLVLSVFLLFSCTGPRTIQDIKENYTYKVWFTVHDDYREVYYKILDDSRQRFRERAHGDLFDWKQSGRISVIGAFIESEYWLLVDVLAVNEGNTKVIAYSGVSSFNRHARNVKKLFIEDEAKPESPS